MSRASSRTAAVLLLAAASLALFWWTRGRGESPLHAVGSDVRACRANLQEIYRGLRAYRDRHGHAPRASGVAFFAALIAEGVWENTPANARKLTCPGKGAHAVPDGVDFADPASLGPASSAYAGRDQVDHPLPKFPSGGAEIETLIACDDARGMNHDGALNVLLSDGTIKTYLLDRLIAEEKLPAGATNIPVGPDSPLADLRVLVAD